MPQEADMQEWTVDAPQAIDIPGEVRSLAVRLVAGHVDVVTTDGAAARVEVTEVDDDPLTVSIDDDGRLVIRHERLTWGGILGWLKSERRRAVVSVAVPARCDTSIGVVSADAVVAGVHGKIDVRCVSGDIVLDEVTGKVSAESVSGDVEARRPAGSIVLKSVSGGLTVVDGAPEKVRVDNVSGDVALDLRSPSALDITVNTVSGDLTVRLPEHAGLTVDLLSTSGDVACAFDGLDEEKRPGVRRLRGSVGDASGRLRGRTVSGAVAILARQPA
jgi:Putative adhesin